MKNIEAKLADQVSRQVVFATPNQSIREAYGVMRANHCRHLPVLENGEIIGILSNRDVQRAIRVEVQDFPESRIADLSLDPQLRVSDFMSWPLVKADKDSSVSEVAALMIARKVSSVLIESEGAFYGIITHEDLLQVLVDLLKDDGSGLTHWTDRLLGWTRQGTIARLIDQLNTTGI